MYGRPTGGLEQNGIPAGSISASSICPSPSGRNDRFSCAPVYSFVPIELLPCRAASIDNEGFRSAVRKGQRRRLSFSSVRTADSLLHPSPASTATVVVFIAPGNTAPQTARLRSLNLRPVASIRSRWALSLFLSFSIFLSLGEILLVRAAVGALPWLRTALMIRTWTEHHCEWATGCCMLFGSGGSARANESN